jgi:Uma2 family endonuclease
MILAPAPPKTAEETESLVVRFWPLFEMTPDVFYEFCGLNPDLNLELTAEGEVVVMSPSGGATGARNLAVAGALWQWARENKQGTAFDSSTGFVLPDGAVRSPDASWVRRERLVKLTQQQRERFLLLCPDFVVEVASPTDRLVDLQQKMDEYMTNGAQLGWLLVPATRVVTVYHPGQPPTTLENATSLPGDPVLPGFVLDLEPIWQPGI